MLLYTTSEDMFSGIFSSRKYSTFRTTCSVKKITLLCCFVVFFLSCVVYLRITHLVCLNYLLENIACELHNITMENENTSVRFEI